jgi:transposase
MICPVRPPAKRCKAYFAEAPWTEESRQWRTIDDELPENDPARLVVSAVEKLLDLQPLWASYSLGGSDALRPDLMLKIVLIEVWLGRQHPSQWFKDTLKDACLRWAGLGIRPSRSSWYNFRDRLQPYIDAWFRQVLQIAHEVGITPARRGSLDGSFIGANASRHHLLNEERLEKRRAELKRQCAEDAQAAGEQNAVPAWMAKTPATRLEQAERYAQAKTRLDEFQAVNERQNPARRRPRNKIVVSTTDPPSAVGWDKQKVFRPLYNLQLMRDLDSPLALAYEVFAQNTDSGLFQPMVRRTRDEMRIPLAEVFCDATYVTGCNLALCAGENITLYGPWQENDYSRSAAKGKQRMIPKEQFTWLPAENRYRCPQGNPLDRIGKQKRKQADGEINVMHIYHCVPKHCQACPLQSQCTKSPARGRSVKRSEHEDLVVAHRARMATEEAKTAYRLRKQTVELGYADIKANRKLREFSGRGLSRVRAQAGLNELARNLIIVERTLRNRESQSGVPENAANNTS